MLAPVILIVAAMIKLDSSGPGFYRCPRIGQGGREFGMLKFRKMHDGARGPALASADDERFTRLGPFLARTKLDELPQLWNVLRGQMSLVGPRPEDPSFIDLHPAEFAVIHGVKPGVTGLCQLAFARESTVLDPQDRLGHYVNHILPQKVSIDQLYASQRSIGMDLRILGWTAVAVLFGREVAVHRQTGALSRRASRTRDPGNGNRPSRGLSTMSDTFELHAAEASRRTPRARSNGAGSLKDVKAVVLAGGRGTRLAPYTTILPKPLMPVGDQSILEIVVGQLEKAGVVDIKLQRRLPLAPDPGRLRQPRRPATSRSPMSRSRMRSARLRR